MYISLNPVSMVRFMALAKGQSKMLVHAKVTEHTHTAMAVTSRFTGATFTMHAVDAATSVIVCDGVGYIGAREG